MKFYHGTSFENAIRVALTKELIEPKSSIIHRFLQVSENLNAKLNHEAINKRLKERYVCLTPFYKVAEQYAYLHEKPFILEIDLNVIPYARIHEYGGTIDHPGGTPYFIGDDGLAKFVSKAKGAGLPVTKPHQITIPARPYIAPAIRDFEAETLPKIIDIMLRKLAEAAS